MKRLSISFNDSASDTPKKTRVSFVPPVVSGVPCGALLSWGSSDAGQLGHGSSCLARRKPKVVSGLNDKVLYLAAGGMHSCAITTDGKIHTFGCNDDGQLGDDRDDDDDCSVPEIIELPSPKIKAIQVVCGGSFTAILTEHRSVYATGSFKDTSGSIGLIHEGPKLHKSPIELKFPHTLSKIVAGENFLAGLTTTGHIMTIGCGSRGCLGRIHPSKFEQDENNPISPEHADLLLKLQLTPDYIKPRHSLRRASVAKGYYTDIFAGEWSCFGIANKNDDVYAWGLNSSMQLGLGEEDMTDRFYPKKIPALCGRKWKEISGGLQHIVCLDTDGKVFSLGCGFYGRLGTGNTEHQSKLCELKLPKCIQVSCGVYTSFAVTEEGKLYAWGMGGKQLGIAGNEEEEGEDVLLPTCVHSQELDKRKVFQIAVASQHTCCIASAPIEEPKNGLS